MTMFRGASAIALALAATFLGACRDDPLGPRTIGLECEKTDGSVERCDLILSEEAGFRITLLSTDCAAVGNTVRVTKPVVADPVVTDDGCSESPGVLAEYPGPFPAGTAVGLQLESPRAGRNSGLIASGSFPEWTIEFEDGADTDFNDLVLRFTAILPAP